MPSSSIIVSNGKKFWGSSPFSNSKQLKLFKIDEFNIRKLISSSESSLAKSW